MRLSLRSAAPVVVALMLGLGLTGCAGRWAYRQGRAEAKAGNWDMAVARLTRALQKDPDNIEYKLALESAKVQASRFHHGEAQKHLAANELEKAADELDIARKYDPSNQAFTAEADVVKDRIRVREDEKKQRSQFDTLRQKADAAHAPVPMLSPRTPVPITINMPDASLQKVLDTLAQLAGVNILYDAEFRDKQTTVKLKGVTFQEALDQLTFVNRLFYKVIDQNTLIIAPENPNKRRQYDENLIRTFYLQNADPNEVQNAMRIMLQGSTPLRLAANMGLSAITVAGNADEIALAAKIVEAYDKPLGEVLVEVEIIDISRTAAKKYGIELANYSGALQFAPFAAPGSDTNIDIRGQLLSSFNISDFVVNIPSKILYSFLQTDSTSHILASPRLRAAAGKQTSLRVGTEVPIPVTSFTATNTAGTGASSFAPATSFQYRNVGINMELTPKINADGDVKFDPMKAEFSLIGNDRDVGGLKIPEFLTRVVSGSLNIHDGETALIGGLIQRSDSVALSGIIGIQSIPILNKLFNSPKKQNDDSEILISLTPHVVRGPKLRESDLASLYVGTKETVKVPGAQAPLLGGEEPTPVPTPVPPPQPVTPPVGVAPPPPPVAPGAPTPLAAVPPPAPAGAPGAPDEAVTVLVSPPDANVRIGDTVAISIVVLRAKDIVGAEVSIAYDAEGLDAVDAVAGSLLTLDGAAVTSSDNNLGGGHVHAHFTRPSGASGSGAIATVRFKAKRVGPAAVTLDGISITSPTGSPRMTLPGPGRVTVIQ